MSWRLWPTRATLRGTTRAGSIAKRYCTMCKGPCKGLQVPHCFTGSIVHRPQHHVGNGRPATRPLRPARRSAPAAKQAGQGPRRRGLLLLGGQAVCQVWRLDVVERGVQEDGAEGHGAQGGRHPAGRAGGGGGWRD